MTTGLLYKATIGVAFFFSGWCAAQTPQLPAQAMAGDLIFRAGTEGVSHAVMAVDQGLYSHVGLLIGTPENWQVVHATPSERRGTPDAVVLDDLAFYLDAQRASGFQVMQVHGVSATQRQQVVNWALGQKGRRFHMLDRTLGTYCTTLVWDAWQHAGLDLQVHFTQVSLPLLSGSYLLPSALAASPHLRALAAP
ncbi:YiiX/YebB-like N1pC/P60 family cysteine hydrolase [Comamonas sp. NoAH]|uniref:YiiX/YebB-like N1pC/P60 family cysteine hydrolase n=1 Tax=Comamonas halotolerans TaxID=3041496 RepID=UPI0024E15393|nr:YiiX/YebB-like N1pC/P60 family cysteine hydrolase [Comamonas sp. NoAH]